MAGNRLDEFSIQIHGTTREGRLWVYRDITHGTCYFDWHSSRASHCILSFLVYDKQTNTIGQWQKIIHCFEDGALELDSNLVENIIRLTNLGMKNWILFGSVESGTNNAILYTLLANCNAQGLDPEYYLTKVLQRLPHNANREQAAALTPATSPPSAKPAPHETPSKSPNTPRINRLTTDALEGINLGRLPSSHGASDSNPSSMPDSNSELGSNATTTIDPINPSNTNPRPNTTTTYATKQSE